GRAAEELLHALVHEPRLAHLGAAVELEEAAQGLVPALRAPVRARGGAGQLALEPAHLAAQLVAILARQSREVLVPGPGEREDRAALLELGRDAEAVGGRERGQQRQRGRGAADRVEVPFDRPRAAMQQERLPQLLLAARRRVAAEMAADA